MNYYLIEIETKTIPIVSSMGSLEKIMYRLVKAEDEETAKKKAAESVNKINFEIVDMENLTILSDE